MAWPPALTNPGTLTNTTSQFDLHKNTHMESYNALVSIISQITADEALITANANAINATNVTVQANADAATSKFNQQAAQMAAMQAQIDALVGTPTPPPSNTSVTMVGFTPAQLDKIIAARAAGSPTAEQTTIKNLYAQFIGGSSSTPGHKTSHPTAADTATFPAFTDSSNGTAYDSNQPVFAVRCLAQAIRYYVEGDTQCRDNVISETAVAAGGTGWMSTTGFPKTTVFYTSNVSGHTTYTNAKLDPAWIMGPLAAACSIVAYKDDLDNPVTPVWTEARRQATRDWFWNSGFAVTPGGAPSANPPATGAAMMNHTSANNWIATMFNARVNIAGWLLSGNATSQANGQAILTNAINWYRDMVTWLCYLTIDAASPKQGSGTANHYPLFMNENDSLNDTNLEKAQFWWFGDAKVGDVGFGGATVAAGSPYAANFFDGLVQEHGRDISHVMMTLGSLANGCATVLALGTDLFDDTTNENGRRLRIAFETTAGMVNEALDRYWNNTGTYPGGIDSSASNAVSGSSWLPLGGPNYGGILPSGWAALNLGTTDKTPAGGTPAQTATDFSLGGNAYVNGWGAAAFYFINVKGYHMPQLDRLRRRLPGTAATVGNINSSAGLDGTQSLQAQDPSMSNHFNLSLDTYPWWFQPHTVIAHDGFNRSVASGNWGNSDTTNQSGDTLPSFAWAMADDSAHPTLFTVDNTTGRARISINNATPKGQTLPVNAADVDVYCRFDLDKLPLFSQTSFPSLHLQGRRAGTTWYSAAVRVNPPAASGQPSSLGLRLYASIAGTLTQLPGMGVTSPFSYSVGAGMWVRLYIKGSKIQMKCWLSTYDTPANEPVNWDLSTTDTQITAAGAIGIYEGIAGSTDPGFPILFSSDHLHVKAPV